MIERRYWRWRLVVLAVLAVTFAVIVPVPSSDAVPPSNRPFFMAGGQCKNGEPFVRWRVQNTESVNHTLYISVNGVDVVGPKTVKAGVTKDGKFVHEISGNPVASVVARWDDGGPNDTSELLFRMSLCDDGVARGPWFITGQYCKNGNNKVRFKIKNTDSTQRHMNVDVSDKNNINEERIWPKNVQTVVLLPGDKVKKNRKIPEHFNAGQEVRVRGWWRINDPEAHNRVGFVLHDCS